MTQAECDDDYPTSSSPLNLALDLEVVFGPSPVAKLPVSCKKLHLTFINKWPALQRGGFYVASKLLRLRPSGKGMPLSRGELYT